LRSHRQLILVAEDDEDFRELLVEHLRASGRRVHPVRDGAEALAAMSEAGGAIGLVLLDLRMPVLDGFEVCRRLERSTGITAPVVVMTAEQELRSVPAYRCVVAVLQKPLELQRLDALVDAHLA
jgi:DNA-binding response OmpR family regulator